jgi:hypothetical protein
MQQEVWSLSEDGERYERQPNEYLWLTPETDDNLVNV